MLVETADMLMVRAKLQNYIVLVMVFLFNVYSVSACVTTYHIAQFKHKQKNICTFSTWQNWLLNNAFPSGIEVIIILLILNK